jgi:hypothetical protein
MIQLKVKQESSSDDEISLEEIGSGVIDGQVRGDQLTDGEHTEQSFSLAMDTDRLLGLCSPGHSSDLRLFLDFSDSSLSDVRIQSGARRKLTISRNLEGGNLLEDLFQQGSLGAFVTLLFALFVTRRAHHLEPGKVEELIALMVVLATIVMVILHQVTDFRRLLDYLLFPDIARIVGALNLFLVLCLTVRLHRRGGFRLAPSTEEVADEQWVEEYRLEKGIPVRQSRLERLFEWFKPRQVHAVTRFLVVALLLCLIFAPFLSKDSDFPCSVVFSEEKKLDDLLDSSGS